jgi:hypothetical protein
MARGGLRTQRTNTEAKPVSGPGALSQRTDMDPIQPGQVPASQVPKVPPARVPSPASASNLEGMTRQPVTNIFAPTENPDEPITAGAPMGMGRNPEPATQYGMIQKYMPQLESLAAKEDAPESFKIFLGLVKSSINEGV